MLIFIYGDDALRVKERAEDMRVKFAEKFDSAGMNVDEFVFQALADHEAGTVIGAIQASPFLATKRMVVVRGLTSLVKKTDAKHWIEGLSHVPESTIAILADSISPATFEKSALYKALEGVNDVHAYPLPQLEGAELQTWASNRAKVHGTKLDASMLNKLLTRTGSDTFRIDGELHKLASYANGEAVTDNMLELLVRPEPNQDIFAFLDALSSGRPDRSIAKLSEERAAGTDEFQLFGMLLRQIRLLLQVSDVLKNNPRADKKEVADALALHPYVAQKIMAEVRGWSDDRLKSMHELAFKLDKAMKTGLPPDVGVDRLVSGFLLSSSRR